MICSLKKTRTFSLLDGALKDESRRLVVWWYGPITKNIRPESVPKIHVFFRVIDENNKLGGLVRREASLTHIGLLRIGSVWKEGVCNSRLDYEKRTFDISFSQGGWRIISLGSFLKSGRSLHTSFFDENYLPLDKQHKTYLIEFYSSDGTSLLIPCAEFYARCYGRSSEIKRVLSTYDWQEVKRRLYKPVEIPPQPGVWPVKFTYRVHKDDAIILAHIYYDRYAELAAKSIYSQIEAKFSSKDQPFVFLKVTPWFQGEGQLSVAGVPIDNGQSFLALQVLGCTQPSGETILRERDKVVPGQEENGAADMAGIPYKNLKDTPDIIDLTEDAPDHGSSWLDLPEDELSVLGKPRVVLDKRNLRENMLGNGSISIPGDEKIFSTDEPYGSGKEIGQVSVHAPIALESRGTLRDMWDALQYLKSAYPKTIHEVGWFTFADGFSSAPEPKLIKLEPFKPGDEVGASVARWVYIDTQTKAPRGVLVMRVRVCEETLYIMEVQRRPLNPKALEGEEPPKTQSFKGMVFTINNQLNFEEWLRKLLSDVRHVKGVVQKLAANCPGVAHAFKHVKAKDEKVSCETSVYNAFAKIGITREDLF